MGGVAALMLLLVSVQTGQGYEPERLGPGNPLPSNYTGYFRPSEGPNPSDWNVYEFCVWYAPNVPFIWVGPGTITDFSIDFAVAHWNQAGNYGQLVSSYRYNDCPDASPPGPTWLNPGSGSQTANCANNNGRNELLVVFDPGLPDGATCFAGLGPRPVDDFLGKAGETDVILNTGNDHANVDTCCLSVEGIVVHEIGHAFGLGHTWINHDTDVWYQDPSFGSGCPAGPSIMCRRQYYDSEGVLRVIVGTTEFCLLEHTCIDNGYGMPADDINALWFIYGDVDRDGCVGAVEHNHHGVDPQNVGGLRDPSNPWDFYDVPVPALSASAPGGTKSRVVTLGDVLAVQAYVGTIDNGAPNVNGYDYDSNWNGNGIEDGREYDRNVAPDPTKPWIPGPPNGVINLSDVLVALDSVNDSCIARGPSGVPPTP